MKQIMSILLLLFSFSAQAADRYVVILKDSNHLTAFSSVTDMKINLKKETLKGIASLQAATYQLSANSIAFQPENIYWGIKGFSAMLSSNEVSAMIATGKVDSVYLDRKVYLNEPVSVNSETGVKYTYGLNNIGIADLNKKHPEIDGSGVTVGIIDTGVDASHPDLKGRVMMFHDFVDNKTEPYDDNGHGTHVAGTISGGNTSGTQIGVAPGVKIFAAKVFSAEGSANDTDILAAMQWMLDPDNNPATNDQPAVVSNSWGGDQSSKDLEKSPYKKMLDTWVAAGMFPSFAAGNSGDSPGTVGVPGGLPAAYAVCAVDSRNVVAYFSSRGPITWTIDGKDQEFVKPEICAPGVGVQSSMPGGKYGNMSGTSMATPHISGVVALVKQANPKLTPVEIMDLLNKTAKKIGGKTAKDNAYGYGLVDAVAAVEAAIATRN